MKEIFEYIEQHHDAYLEELFTFLRCKKHQYPGWRGEGMCRASCRNHGEKQNQGIHLSHGQASNCIRGTYRRRNPSHHAGIRHYDVQPPEPLGEWESEPFEPTIRDGKIFCRGVSDDKSQLFTHIKAAQAWAEVKGRHSCQYKIPFWRRGRNRKPGFASVRRKP